MGNFKDLNVWQCGMSLATNVYAFVKKLPMDEKYGLVDQIRRQLFLFPQISQKEVEEIQRKNFATSFQLQQDRLQNLKRSCCFVAMLVIVQAVN